MDGWMEKEGKTRLLLPAKNMDEAVSLAWRNNKTLFPQLFGLHEQ
jgi:hypothetical protein